MNRSSVENVFHLEFLEGEQERVVRGKMSEDGLEIGVFRLVIDDAREFTADQPSCFDLHEDFENNPSEEGEKRIVGEKTVHDWEAEYGMLVGYRTSFHE